MNLLEKLSANLGDTAHGRAWLRALPAVVDDLCDRWSLRLGHPFVAEASCSWVAACVCSDASTAVLKVGFPHMEAEQELAGLAFWSGDPTVRLLEADTDRNAMLLEYCDPGSHLRRLPQPDQDVVVAGLLQRLWRAPPQTGSFRPLRHMLAHWCDAARKKSHLWTDAPLAEEGLGVLDELANQSSEGVLLATDLHAGNVLKAQREPWLVIDPKPFFGDPAYDVTQHLMNCRARLADDPLATINRVARLAGVDGDRVRRWMFARLAIDTDASASSQALARRIGGT